MTARLREFPYNYTSFSDREIVIRLQGLAGYNDVAGTDTDYIVVEIARHPLGKYWLPDYVAKANRGGIERVLL